MVQTHQWNVSILAQTVLGEIDPSSVYYTGPFQPNTQQTLASLKIKNTGTIAGTVDWRLYDYPGIAGPPGPGCTFGCGVEMLVAEGSVELNPGATSSPIAISHLTPTHTLGQAFSWPLGIKVKGETEANWANWGMGLRTGRAFIFNGKLVDSKIVIVGVAAAVGIIGLLWYTKHKHMW